MESRANNVLIAMMMLAVILLVWTRATSAALVATEQAYELDASQIERWPLGDDGSLILRPCGGCDRVVLRVNAETRYGRSLSGPAMTREELLQLKSTGAVSGDTLVYVFYRPDDGVVTRLVLDVGN